MSQKNATHKNPVQAGDLRVRRTRKMLQDAFIALVIEQGFEAITVQTLSERAMINRATFYRHYEDKFDLAEKVYTDLTDEYAASVRTTPLTNPQEAWLLLLEHIAAYGDFYVAMLSTMPRFRERVCDGIEQQLHAEFLRLGLDETNVLYPLPLISRYLAAAQMGVIQWWLEEGRPIPSVEMAHYLMQLHLYGGIDPLQLPAPPYVPPG